MPEHDKRPYVVGLTGSIGMGKTETAKLFAGLGIPVLDSDAVVRGLYNAGGEAVEPIAAEFPRAVRNGCVDRAILAEELVSETSGFDRLEAIVHPLVRRVRDAFVERAARQGEPMVVLDIPLLFETGAQKDVDAVVVVSAPRSIQELRVLARPGMTPEKLNMLLSRQIPDSEKRAQANFVIETDKGLEQACQQVQQVAAELLRRANSRSARAR